MMTVTRAYARLNFSKAQNVRKIMSWGMARTFSNNLKVVLGPYAHVRPWRKMDKKLKWSLAFNSIRLDELVILVTILSYKWPHLKMPFSQVAIIKKPIPKFFNEFV